MESKRLILVPQLPVHLRYQDWWIREFEKGLSKYFTEIFTLGRTKTVNKSYPNAFSFAYDAIENELEQIREYMEEVVLQPNDTLLHLDLSWPGLFHQVLYHKRPKKAFVFCHATSRNRFDVFSGQRTSKWLVEKGNARIYDFVFVASDYHRKKLEVGGLTNVWDLGALPNPPEDILGDVKDVPRRHHCVSVSNRSQKVNRKVELEFEAQSGSAIVRYKFVSPQDYYDFLRSSRYLIVTSKEETYGYQIVDAVLCGCIPIAPNAFSYPELLPECFLYDNTGTPEEQASTILDKVKHLGVQAKLKNTNLISSFFDNLGKVIS